MKLMALLTLVMTGAWCPAGSTGLVGPADESLPVVSKVAAKGSTVISPVLQAAVLRVRTSGREKNFATPLMKIDDTGAVQVLVSWDTNSKSVVGALAKEGFRVDTVNDGVRMAQGWLPLARLERAAGLPGITSITLPGYARTRAGAVETGVNAAMGVDLVRSQLGYIGSGSKIGVISDGMEGYDGSVIFGDLPMGIQIDPDLPGSGYEGGEMLEVIHDTAPAAALAFSGPRTKLEFLDALDYLVNEVKCDIIVDDLGFYDEPYFQDGIVAQAVAGIVDQVVYVSAAGNDGFHHYQGLYVDSNPEETGWAKDLHDFGGGDNVMPITIPARTQIAVFLQWADPFGEASDDYDLFLYNDDLSTALTWSNAVQDGNDDPYEALTYSNETDEPITAYVVISRASGEACMMEMYTWDTSSQAFSTASNAIFGHPAVPGVLSVGMTRWDSSDRDTLALDSSQGPSGMYFPIQTERQTPRLVAWDGINVSNSGGRKVTMYGSSAAAALVAGLAALVKESMPETEADSPSMVRSQMEDLAEDLGVTGFDTVYGAGRSTFILSSKFLVPPGQSDPVIYGNTGVSIGVTNTTDSGMLNVSLVSFSPPNIVNALTRYWNIDGLAGSQFSLLLSFLLGESDFPSMVLTKNEARLVPSFDDSQNYDVTVFRSLDNGQTWQAQETSFDALNLIAYCPNQQELGLYAIVVSVSSKEAVSGEWELYQ